MEEKNLKFIEIKTGGAKVEVILDATYRPPCEDERVGEDAKMIHLHPYYEVFFASTMKLVTESEVRFYENSVVILPPGFKHYSVRGAGTYRFFLSVISAERGSPIGKLFAGVDDAKMRSAKQSQSTAFYLGELCRCLSVDGISHAKIEPLLMLILLDLAEIFSSDKEVALSESRYGRVNEYAFLIDQLISRCFTEKITLSAVAKELYLSEKQTARIIAMRYGTTLSKLIADRKTSAAAMLLKNTDESVSEIIRKLNFGTECYFYSLFKKKYACTPLAYRNKERRNRNDADKPALSDNDCMD